VPNVVKILKMKFYVVWEGHKPGIYDSWDECKKQIKNYPKAKYKAFPTLVAAKQALGGNPFDFFNKKDPSLTINLAGLDENAPKPVFPSISVDAACNGSPGDMEYRGVDTQSGREFFRQGPYPDATNNVGEFLAIVHALAFLKQNGSSLPIYTDSITAISWVRKRKSGTKLALTSRNAKVFELLSRAESWLKENTWKNPILKWETHIWGEIPADYGRK
jgi:ribonuclease HI